MKLESIDFPQILKNAWQITWKHRFLWWFGMLIALGSGGGMQYRSIGNQEKNSQGEMMMETWRRIMDHYGTWIWIGVAVIIVLVIIVWVLRIISQAGIIRSLDQVSRGEATNFASGFAQGKVYFWKIFFIDITISFLLLLLIIVFLVPVIFLFTNKAIVLGILIALMAVAIFIPVAVMAGYMRRYSYYYIVLANLDVREALENSYLVFRRNIIPSIILSLIFIPISIIFFLAIISAAIIIGASFFILGLIAHFIFSAVAVYIIIGIAILIFVAVVILFRSVFETFVQTVWYLFFKQIASEKIAETVLEEKAIVEEKVSEAGV
jgi:hypothetical protein